MRLYLLVLILPTVVCAAPVNHDLDTGIVAMSDVNSSISAYALCADGSVYYFHYINAPEGVLTPDYQVNLPIDTIFDWRPTMILTNDGHIWRLALNGDNWEWYELIMPICDEGAPAESQSLGDVKSMFR